MLLSMSTSLSFFFFSLAFLMKPNEKGSKSKASFTHRAKTGSRGACPRPGWGAAVVAAVVAGSTAAVAATPAAAGSIAAAGSTAAAAGRSCKSVFVFF